MSTHDPNDLRDTRVDAAWRAASREEPPAALDDAIRAAARREIGAGPHSTEAKKAGVPESLRPERWWWPLAAAATIGAIAIGLLQLVEPDQVGAPGADKMVASDMPAAPAQSKKQDAAPRTETDAPQQEQAAKPAMPEPAAAPPSAARDRVAPAPPRPPTSAPAPKALRKDAAAPFPRDEGAAAVTLPAKPSAPEERTAANTAVPAPPVAQPFPADALKRESKETAMRDAAPAAGIIAPPAAPPAEAAKPGIADGKLATAPAEPAREAQRSTLGGAQYAQPQSATRRVQEAEDARGSVSAAAPKAQATAATRAKVAPAPKLPVPEWIALIRKLRDEGRTDEAAKELAAFRTAYADHERILPPDLRDWKPVAR